MASSIPIPNARPQNTFFYTDDWTSAIDNWFIEKLAGFASKKNATLTWRDIANIRMAMKEVNDLYDTTFSFDQCFAQFKKLEERHKVFSFITSLHEIYYDETNNIMHAFHNYIWEYIVLKYALGEAYIIKGEPVWDHLCTIFGTPPHVAAMRVPDFVNLTSSKDTASVEIVEQVDKFPRQTFDMHKNSYSSSFWDELAEFGNEAWSDPSVGGSQHSVNSDTNSYVTPPLIPRSLWPEPGSLIVVDSPRPKSANVPVKLDDDRVSSTGSSGNIFKPLQRPGKEKR